MSTGCQGSVWRSAVAVTGYDLNIALGKRIAVNSAGVVRSQVPAHGIAAGQLRVCVGGCQGGSQYFDEVSELCAGHDHTGITGRQVWLVNEVDVGNVDA